ncbi:MAG: hypothetical protein A2Y41_08680 [Spirochaetes bacterium GWB1_36_13]|nr:MAG: hypothetical protein A2Y41_08680 [Spirochaetes bacterium GWB1_36_13]
MKKKLFIIFLFFFFFDSLFSENSQSVDFGFHYKTGNLYRKSLRYNLESTIDTGDFLFNNALNGEYGETRKNENIIKVSIHSFNSAIDYFLYDKIFGILIDNNFYYEAEYSLFKHFHGLGPKLYPWRYEKSFFSISYMFLFQRQVTPLLTKKIYRHSLRPRLILDFENWAFKSIFLYQVDAENKKDYIFENTNKLEFKFTTYLSFELQVIYKYESQTIRKSKDDFAFLQMIKIKF